MAPGIGDDETKRARLRRAVVPLAVSSVGAPVVVIAVLAAALVSVPAGTLPAEKRGPGSPITRIYAADGRQIAALRAFERFIPVPPGDIPTVVKDAVLAVEDRRFYSHQGVDFRSVLRALWVNLNEGRIVQGGSTITQQYVKQAYMTDRDRSFTDKLREAVLASRVEQEFSKDEILHRYLSTVYLGSGAYGVGAAADTYFRKPVSELTLSEAALLAGMIRAPTLLDPRSNRHRADARRRVVLQRMYDQHRIADEHYRAALDERVTLVADGDPPDGPATLVHPPRSDRGQHQYFVDYVTRYLVARYGETKVFEGGLRVETSLDPRLQALAESAAADALAGTDPPLEMSLVSIDPRTGLVRALVGGRDFTRSQVNLALGNCVDDPEGDDLCVDGGGSGRQPGSLFKVFVLARALEEGRTLRTVYRAPARYRFPSCRGAGCTVANAGRRGYRRMSLKRATAHSVNTVFAQLVRDVGVKDTAELAHRLGVTTVPSDGKRAEGEPYGPSLALGAAEVSPLAMAAAYGVFANRGVRLPASPVVRVTAADGEVLEDNTARRGRRVLAAAVADRVTEALRDVVEYGTGTAAEIPVPAAGKTGTAENHTDAWFAGFTANLSTAVWMGYADSQRPLTHINGQARVYGGTIPARTWAAFMTSALVDPAERP
ncbi:MAG TPA: transglycosylase domain-containing protein [Acidimicrobiales bacterium]|nr:transglycosylase domain-containing protein [Acidimicrobiales bacterium]